MKKSVWILIVLFFSCASAKAQEGKSDIDKFYRLLRTTFQRQRAYNTVAYVEKRWRLAGNSGFNESIFYVEKILREAGFKKEQKGEDDHALTYRIEKRPLKEPTWEPEEASVVIGDSGKTLLTFASNRNMLAIHSASTPDAGIKAEIIYVGAGAKSDFAGKDVSGKIVFGESNVASLYKNAIEKGALGVMAYSLPSYVQPIKHIHSIQFQRIPYSSPADQKWGILLSHAAKESLKQSLSEGPVVATVKVKTKIYTSEELTLVANVRGTGLSEERFVFSAHVQEPGANDNASGVATLAEMARITASLFSQGKIKPARTITFLWGDEIVSTRRYITENPQRAKKILWGLSLDMVGEDVAKTGGTFLIEKMPDPSAIWTRGEEKHTEWGGSALKESEMFPHYFSDFLLNRCMQQSEENGWIVKTNPFEGGSDHTPFLEAKIPGLLMWHFTDVFYHTDADRLDMVSPEEMRNVGISALASAYTLCSANEKIVLYLIAELKTNAFKRLDVEFELGKKAIPGGSDIEHEKHILDVWAAYYAKAIEKLSEITHENPDGIQQAIQLAINEIQTKERVMVEQLRK